jgi:hypothetical protein
LPGAQNSNNKRRKSGLGLTMTTFKINPDSDLSPGDIVEINGLWEIDDFIVYGRTREYISVARWDWIAKIISWNPCNGLTLSIGLFQ